MKKKILVLGATGLVGKEVAKQLNVGGYNVVVMSRSREKAKEIFSEDFEIIEADLQNEELIKHSFTGINGVFISLPEQTVPEVINNIVKLCKQSNVQQIVYTSGCTVREENAWHPMIKGHYEAEKAIKESGVPYTILGLTMIMDTIPAYANNGKPFILGKQNFGWSWIHTSDIAKMTTRSFFNTTAFNKKFTIWGKENLTIAKAVQEFNIANNLGDKPVKPKPFWMAKLIALFVGEKLKYAISIFKYFENHSEEGNPAEAYSILGEPQMTIEKFFELERMSQNNKA
jgi:uncharacterized protein YbjT (DUF2867 family)